MNLNKMNKELAANTNVSHYRIVSKIDAGGMGEVYERVLPKAVGKDFCETRLKTANFPIHRLTS